VETLKTGSKAYWDSFTGLVPASIVSIQGVSGLASTAQIVVLELTGTRGAYRKGERVETSGLHAVPRASVRFRKHGTRILSYRVEV